ncbi:RagB/SusD family nutrient uptake outer membrane protein [Arenibacter algicola]|uniref:RagB/SusD family nutrient uptake outer membrane protein n=1 Tax=Arenibacter algicola TaxID=616991 RepID=UPI001C0760B1|nr:RagB/SusD family nutrient uptake outer membrane protein [Arenibacter algicola]MBU2905129.1 RagB/SusD family nutrient uptake outer membrane protein [Arenibacter algicola]
MNTKNIYKTILLNLTMGLLLLGCTKDFLDRNDLNGLAEGNFFKTESDATQALNAVYGVLQENTFTLYAPLLGSATDEIVRGPGSQGFSDLSDGTEAPGNSDTAIQRRWNHCYEGVFRANYFIENVQNVEMDEALKNKMVAEARFLRGFFHANLVPYFGDVPLLLNTVSIDEAVDMVRTPKADVMASAISDIRFGIDNLPTTVSENGRLTKGAAAGFLARVLLNEKNYDATINVTQDIINGVYGSYSLFPNFSTLLYEENEGNSEILFDIHFSNVEPSVGESINWHSVTQSSAQGSATFKELVDAFESTNGLTIDDPNNTLFDSADEYANRDPRLWASIQYPGAVYGIKDNDGNFIYNRGVWPAWLTGDSNDFPWSNPYHMKKYLNPLTDPPRQDGLTLPDGTNFVVVRFADVLLMFAEAKIESGSIDQSVLDAINTVRARAYGTIKEDTSNYPAITTMDQAELRVILRRERRVELAFEGLRWLDLVRWGTLKEAKAAVGKGWQANIWPIPESEIERAKGLTQNAPWN